MSTILQLCGSERACTDFAHSQRGDTEQPKKAGQHKPQQHKPQQHKPGKPQQQGWGGWFGW